jgi:hypothetical protein
MHARFDCAQRDKGVAFNNVIIAHKKEHSAAAECSWYEKPIVTFSLGLTLS